MASRRMLAIMTRAEFVGNAPHKRAGCGRPSPLVFCNVAADLLFDCGRSPAQLPPWRACASFPLSSRPTRTGRVGGIAAFAQPGLAQAAPSRPFLRIAVASAGVRASITYRKSRHRTRRSGSMSASISIRQRSLRLLLRRDEFGEGLLQLVAGVFGGDVVEQHAFDMLGHNLDDLCAILLGALGRVGLGCLGSFLEGNEPGVLLHERRRDHAHAARYCRTQDYELLLHLIAE